MKKIIFALFIVIAMCLVVACGPKKITEEPDLTAYLETYVNEKTEALRAQFGIDDLEIVLEGNDNPPIFIEKHRETEEDIGEYDYFVNYYIYAPSFVKDILEKHEQRALEYEDIHFGDQLMHAFSMNDFSVENYVLGEYSTSWCKCRGIIWDKDDTELTFTVEPMGDFDFGEITKRWNFNAESYEVDKIFYYNEKSERIYYSQKEYDENALPPSIDDKRDCVKCGMRSSVTAGGYCASCVKIYKSEWYIDWDGEVSIY